VLSVDHSRRWQPAWRAAHAQLGDGGLGAVRRIVGTTCGERAMLFRNGTHLIDTICWFATAGGQGQATAGGRGQATAGGQGQAGSDPEWVVGVLDEEHAGYGPRYAGDGGRDPALDPGGSALVHFRNGVRAFVNCSKRARARLELHVYCEHGQVRVDDASAEVWLPAGRGLGRVPLAVPLTERADTPAAIAGLIRAIEHGGETLSPAREARNVLAVILAILQSAVAGSAPVRFPVQDA
jgi:predicted dehydrogenase